MPKRAWLTAVSGLFLAAALVWSVPVVAQPQKGGLLDSNNQGVGSGMGGGVAHSGLTKKSQSASGDQSVWKKPDQVERPSPANKNSHTLTRTHSQPQSQTPGGTKIP
jgi:hypothetical protein